MALPKDTKEQLSPITIALHWIVGLMMIGLLGSGLYMEEFKAYAVFPWHKSFGVIIVVLAVLRVLWRFSNGWPQHVAEYTKVEVTLSKIVHYVLIIGTIMMPISGIMMSGLGGYGVEVFGFELIAHNPDPSNPGKNMAINESLATLGGAIHGIAGKLIIAALILHIIGALKHHIIDKDNTLKRMLGMKVNG